MKIEQKQIMKPIPPDKLYSNEDNRRLGIISPSLYHRYILDGDKEVIEFAIKMDAFLKSRKRKESAG